MANSGLSTGCIVGGIIGGFFVLAAIVLVAVVGVGYFTMQRQGPPAINNAPVTGTPVTASSDDGAAQPDPSPAQQAAIADGKPLSWDEQGLSWTVPSNWSKQQETKELFSAKSPGSFDAGWVTVSISIIPEAVPTDISLNAMYQAAQENVKQGKYTSARWLELDGIKGVQFVEAPPDDPTTVQRVQWQAYRTYNGQKQLINLMVHSSGKGFPTHSDTLYGVFYSTKLAK